MERFPIISIPSPSSIRKYAIIKIENILEKNNNNEPAKLIPRPINITFFNPITSIRFPVVTETKNNANMLRAITEPI